MGFRLRITKGKTEGKEFSFTKDRVTVGRNHDNDLVIYDLNISRTHFEIFAQNDGYSVRDMGSRNGTKVNTKPTIEGKLKDGDRIQSGGIEFEFLFSDTQPRVRVEAERGEVNAPSSETQRAMLEHIQTYALNLRDIQAEADRRGVNLPPRSMHKPKDTESVTSTPAKQITSSAVQPLGTQRVDQSVLRRLMRSRATYPLIGVISFALIFGTFMVFFKRTPAPIASVVPLTLRPDLRAFGAGKVDVPCEQKAVFSFVAIDGRAVLRFTPGGVENPGEVQLLFNDQPYQNLATTGAGWGKPVEIKLDRKQQKVGELNTLTFLYNAALGNGRWGVKEISLMQDAVPPPSLERAKELMRVAKDALEHRRVAPQNLATAEESYKRALLSMEGLVPPPAEYAEAEAGYRTARDELSLVLESGLFRVERAQRFSKFDEAEAALRELLLYVPDERDPRREDLVALMSQLRK